MKKLVIRYYVFITFILPTLGIMLAFAGDSSRNLKSTCNRYCHNKGCPHDPILPDYITSTDGYFGDIVRWLKLVGTEIESLLSISSGGYLIANLLLFCILIPVIHIILGIINIKLAGKGYK
jgi:hypothetical protein